MLNKWNLETAKFASKEQSRYSINAIQVEPERTVATDGHSLVVVSNNPALKAEHFPAVEGMEVLDAFSPFLTPAADALAVAKTLPRKVNIPVLAYAAVAKNGDEGMKLVVSSPPDAQIKTVTPDRDSRFPLYQCAFPVKQPVFEITVNGQKLAALVEFLGKFADAGYSSQSAVTLRLYDNETAIRMDAVNKETNQQATGLLMPMRDSGNKVEWPWETKPNNKAARASRSTENERTSNAPQAE